ncbi:unnamed protein product [Adineta ricciae]|uniref:Uncharacterized protein n=1 Tax=Adineta ricciae TaxID=249248 RepID=A0A815ZS46_ADIRI|nr:unnamed protein product [Adineta ricciae]
MHSLSFVLVLFFAIGVLGQTSDDSKEDANDNDLEKGYPFGQLRILADGKTEELISPEHTEIEKSDKKTVVVPDVQPLPSPCIGARPSSKRAFPKEKTKYIFCRDEFHYEILTCPDGVEFNGKSNECDLLAETPSLNRCDIEKPCLNEGVCSVVSNSTFKCTCRSDWTGERCETPVNSCVKKPCGPNAECRPLTTKDYEQDYVCVCHTLKGYGLTCREAVPNPCLTTTEQFYPFAFSQRAYIQCDGELIYFQPCGPLLYWNQEEKICDRKRPAKIDMPAFITVPPTDVVIKGNQEQVFDNTDTQQSIQVSATPQPQRDMSSVQTVKVNSPDLFGFIPARAANRKQLLVTVDSHNGVSIQNLPELEQKTQELRNQVSQMINPSQVRENVFTGSNQWQSQKQRVSGVLDDSSTGVDSNRFRVEQDGQRQQQQPPQKFQQNQQSFGTQQWLNKLPENNVQSFQRVTSQPQGQNVQRNEQVQDDSQEWNMNVAKFPQNTVQLQGFQQQNPREQQTWQMRQDTAPMTGSQFAQSSQTFQTRPQAQGQADIEISSPAQNTIRVQVLKDKDLQRDEQSWQQQTHTFSTRPQKWQNTQSFQRDEQTETNRPETMTFDGSNRLETGFQQTGQRFVPPGQTWQEKQSLGGQQQFQAPIQATFTATASSTTTIQTPHIILPPQRFSEQQKPWETKFQAQNPQILVETAGKRQMSPSQQEFHGQEQSWENRFQKQSPRGQTTQVIAFKPTHWKDTGKQDTVVPSQDQRQLTTEDSFQKQNAQFAFPQQQQQQKSMMSQNTFDQRQTWSNQQMQNGRVLKPTDLRVQSQTEQITGRPIEATTRPTNADLFQGHVPQSFRGQVLFQPNEQSQFGQQSMTEQRQQMQMQAAPSKYAR